MPTHRAVLRPLARAQTELYRVLAELRGIPPSIATTFQVEGSVLAASMLRKGLSGTRTSTVTKVSAARRSDRLLQGPKAHIAAGMGRYYVHLFSAGL